VGYNYEGIKEFEIINGSGQGKDYDNYKGELLFEG